MILANQRKRIIRDSKQEVPGAVVHWCSHRGGAAAVGGAAVRPAECGRVRRRLRTPRRAFVRDPRTLDNRNQVPAASPVGTSPRQYRGPSTARSGCVHHPFSRVTSAGTARELENQGREDACAFPAIWTSA
ncbi:hypothetical protein JDV02_009292 [Purpureocillium takamizusanense]|uniref:Uncharacterized protein n=1 Tax=Purpureocillium takamizusanense TaxID=2060973 RepID=A0A9Q8QRK9_9HYPO|nr:uncharacterized protein JDV02_009292 [Purpureocillium takamizusanense]UNI23474.1 hypothetical protein JDV02_009292 [Purpureocillium takamizusanense]